MSTYLETFQNNLDIVEHIGGAIYNISVLIKDTLQDTIGDIDLLEVEQKEVEETATYCYQVAVFIANTDRHHYGILLEDLENEFLGGDKKIFKNI